MFSAGAKDFGEPLFIDPFIVDWGERDFGIGPGGRYNYAIVPERSTASIK
jgi:hypothetical protein